MAIRNDYTVASPTNSGTLTRSSAGYYWDGTNLTSAATNTERWDEEIEVWYHEGYNASGTATFTTIPKGMLMEPQSTNLVPDSNNLTGGSGTTNTISTGTFVSSNDQIKYTPNNVSSSQFRVYPDSSTFSNSTVYCASALVNPNDIPCLGLYYYFANGSTVCRFDFDTLQWSIPNNNKTINFGVIKYGTTGWYRIWVTGISIRTSGIPLYIYHYPDISTTTWTPNGTDFSQIAHIQFELGYFPSSIILTTGSTATRNADSNAYSYSTTVGSTGTTFGVVQTPFYPKDGNTILQSDGAAAGTEYDVSIDYETDGDIVGSSTDPGTPTTVNLTHTYASGDMFTTTYNQVEVNGSGDADQNLRFYVDDASVGTPAAHNISDGDALDGNNIIVNGYGGLLHRIAIDDTSDQSGNYSYLNLVVAANYDVSITEAITLGDTQTGRMATLQAIAESIAVGDTQSAVSVALGSFSEGVTAGDTQAALATALASISESTNLTDLLSGLQLFLVSISEGISVGDTQSAVASALAALAESITVGDTQTALAGALAALTEGVVTGDTQSGLATALAILAAENVNLNEVLTSLQVFLAYMTESITVADSVSAEAAALAAFAESLAAGDASSATATALAALSEGITNAEVFAAVAAAYASVNEGILVGETWSYPLIGAHLVGTFSIEPLLAASPSNQPLLAATVTTEGLEGVTITINR